MGDVLAVLRAAQRIKLRAIFAAVLAGASFFCTPWTLLPVHAQADGHLPSFEVASIRPAPDVVGMSAGVNGSTWYSRGGSAFLLLTDAFELKHFQVLNAPKWLNSERYTVEAKIPADILQLPEEQQNKQYGPMLQSLLAERFQLRYHWIEQVRPVYSLVVDKNGPKLTEVKPDKRGYLTIGPGFMKCHAMPISGLSETLGGNLDYIVQDRTGLKGSYDFTLRYSRPDSTVGSSRDDELSNPEAQARLFTALQDQLGLKLVAEKRPVRMLEVDSFERPTPN